ncbi:hypothetical protein GF324_05235 [bacterium]|nr:hypothetical protein [bacterium]
MEGKGTDASSAEDTTARDTVKSDTSALTGGPIEMLEVYFDPSDSTRLRLHPERRITGDSLRVRITGTFGGSDTLDSTLSSTTEFMQEADTSQPYILRTDPQESSRLHRGASTVELVFSEEIRVSQPDSIQIITSFDTMQAPFGVPDSFRIVVSYPDTLVGGLTGVMVYREAVLDRAGNALADSVSLYRYPYLPADSLGHVTGIVTADKKAPIHLTLVSIAGKDLNRTLRLPEPGAFEFSDVPAGNWRLRGWLDLDGDGEYNPGGVIPYIPAEPYQVNPDTISVRARWESGGVELTFP